MNLSQRLTDGLIGPKPEGKCTGVDCPGCDYGRREAMVKPTIEKMVATIEADLKGLLTTEKNLGALYNPSIPDLELNEMHGEDRAVVYVEDVDKMITAAIEHYTRGE